MIFMKQIITKKQQRCVIMASILRKEGFVFNVKVPEVAILDLKVKDHSRTGKDQHLGSYAIRIMDMQEGYRRAYLIDYAGAELNPAALFLKINKRWLKNNGK